jgi:hypothetical protein
MLLTSNRLFTSGDVMDSITRVSCEAFSLLLALILKEKSTENTDSQKQIVTNGTRIS